MKTAVTLVTALVCIAALVIFAARVIFALPLIEGRTDSATLAAPEAGPVSNVSAGQGQDHPGKTGIVPLSSGADAFAARMLLADMAVSSIDAQYYIWHGDLTGSLLLEALRRAADRGVRVRLLVDDNGTSGLDAPLAALNAHDNAEVRLYNPFNLRKPKILSYGFDFFRLNRRMHNKSFTVDGTATILGGRNIGDEYFDTGPTALHADLDALAIGQIVPEVAGDFDRYWAAPAVYPAEPIIGGAPPGDPIGALLRQFDSDPQLGEYRAILEQSSLVAALKDGTADIEWTDAVLVSDDPAKGMGAVPRQDLLAVRLMQAVGEIKTRVDGVSPNFVLGKAGVDAFAALQKRGVQTRMLTNSLAATDVLPVHAGYAKRRHDLLAGGTQLFELKQHATTRKPKDKVGPFGTSGASLHAKTFAIDGDHIFIGSFNFDPRSTTMNTEMGLLIDSATMAGQMHDAFDRQLSELAWEVVVQDGHLVWQDDTRDTETRREPGSSMLKNITIIGWLPVEWLL